MLKPYFWKQTDKRWAKHSWKGVTIGSSGCGPTAIACVVSALVKKVTPKIVFDWICKNGYMHPSKGTYWSGITAALKHYGITKFSVSYNTDTALKELKAGKWMIGIVGPSRWTRGGHYIVVYGLHGSKIYVSDPASSSDYRQVNGTWNEFVKAENCMWISIDPKDYGKSSSKSKTSSIVVMYVSEANANIRKGRGTKYGVAGTIKRGTKLELKNYKDGWYKIAKGSYKGKFISGSVLVKYPPHVATYKTNYVMNIRAGYTTKAKILGQCAKGVKIKSAYKVGNWIYVPALKGWVCLKDGSNTYCTNVKSTSSNNSNKKKSNKEIAKEVIAGKWGNGQDRVDRLKKAGYDYDAIQKEVNNLLK